ncbi:hypothetical protein J3D54_005020 [Pseudomonas sp. GGS8]|uniref:hypothetical protein n=1 Tax=Pseudomonas sp. GGS8 TaxID=2817892 RepID=UPI00209CB332|nr:hypothetical protein [Pseudomonas sp. GGS8]MCP1445888.1 hypothetical protein [Pseudomonas sp. GGS8]
MAAADTLHARSMLHNLCTQPLGVLNANAVYVVGLAGADTQSVPLYFGAYQGEIRISPTQHHVSTFLNTGLPVIVPDAVVRCTGLISPMRGHIATTPTRLNLTAQVPAATNKLWVTEQQTGCSVLILKWAGNLYSMVHLQPNADNEFNRLGKLINRSDIGMALQKNAWLRPEVAEVAEQSGNGQTPDAYILVQSLHTARRGNACQVIGININGTFNFYLQTSIRNGLTETYSTQSLQWTPWIDYVPFFTY